LFPQTDPLKDTKSVPAATTPSAAPQANATSAVPLPAARPAIKEHEPRRRRHDDHSGQ
jgi:hypothetical protein